MKTKQLFDEIIDLINFRKEDLENQVISDFRREEIYKLGKIDAYEGLITTLTRMYGHEFQ